MNEAQNIEWKQSWHDEYLKTICAFANTDGGQLFIGKDDSGSTVNVVNYSDLLEDIPSKIKNFLGLICSVNLHGDANGYFVEIIVKSYAHPISYRGKYYVRSGSTTHELNGVELAEFLLVKSGQTWDNIDVEDATIDDIDPRSIDIFLADSSGTGRMPDTDGLAIFEILQKLRLADDSIKRAAIVLFGKDPNAFFPNCRVMIGRFGDDSEDIKFQEIVEGNIIQILRITQEFLNIKFLTRPIDFTGLLRKEKDEYPVAAIREMLLNALVHKKYMGAAIQIRVYDDRLSIWNEGLLPQGMTIESLKQEHNSKPPNPVIANACFKAGYIDTWGRGTLKIYKACADAGMPEPRIIEKDGGIEVTLFKEDFSEELRKNFGRILDKTSGDIVDNLELLANEYNSFLTHLNVEYQLASEELRKNFGRTSQEFRKNFGDKKALLLFLLGLNSHITAKEAADKIGVSSRSVETYLSELKELGIIDREGSTKAGQWIFVKKEV